VTYSLADDNELRIDYRAISSKNTAVNLTHHSYFNLTGQGRGDHNWVLGDGAGDLRLVARVYEPTSGRASNIKAPPSIDSLPGKTTRSSTLNFQEQAR
jgi:aldose 1-epimerase